MESTSSYQLKQGEDNYIFSLTLVDPDIKLSCEDSRGQIYAKIFSLEDIKSIDQIFSTAQTNFDIVEIFDNILRNEKVRVEEDSGLIQIVLFIVSEKRQIKISLDKEEVGNIQGQEEKTFAYDANQIINQIGENLDLNTANYNIEKNLETFDTANVDSNKEVFQTDNIQQNLENITTNINETEGFNYEQYFKNINNEAANIQNDNVNVNEIDYNNMNITETNYIQNANEFSSNINTNIETTSNIPQEQIQTQTTENFTNIESYENINTNVSEPINAQTKQEDIKYSFPEQVDIKYSLPEQVDVKYSLPKQEDKKYSMPEQVDIKYSMPEQVDIKYSMPEQEDKKYSMPEQVDIKYSMPEQVDIKYSLPKQEDIKYSLPKQEDIKYSLPFITRADDEPTNVTNQVINQTTTTTTTSQNVGINLPQKPQYHKVSVSLPKDKKSEEEEQRINKLKNEQIYIKNQHSQINSKILELTNLINSYKSKISLLETQKNSGELDSLRSENQRIRQQLMELNRLRSEIAQANYLRNQLSELDSLRQKAAEVDTIKSQLSEMNNLKMKLSELSGMKDRLNELNKLKEELNRLNQIKSQAQSSMTQTQKVVETTMKKSIIKGDIIHNLSELELITRKINKSNNKITLNLLYKATADSDTALAFHQKCDQAESSLVLIETDKGKRFGGYTSKNWRGDCIDKEDENAFLFSLDKMNTYDSIEGENAIGCYPNFGPIFLGCQIRIFDNAFEKGGTTFEKGMNYETEENFELTGGEQKFGIKEIEVYEVIVE